jgi:hypothetical protein
VIYGFICACGASTDWIATVAQYEASAADGHKDRLCSTCGGPTDRDVVGDMQSQYTEKQQFYGEDTPEDVAGRGGYSRERAKILKAAGLVQKDTGRPPPPRRQHFLVRRERVTAGGD